MFSGSCRCCSSATVHDAAGLKRLGNRISESHLQLYKATPPPEATGRYSWALVGGGVTGLSFGPNPVFLEVFTDPRDWVAHNAHWITALRRQYLHCLPEGDAGGPLTEPPRRSQIGDAAAAHTAATAHRSRPVDRDTLAAFTRPRSAGTPTTPVASGRWATTSPVDDGDPPF
jgi:hypothetical protein